MTCNAGDIPCLEDFHVSRKYGFLLQDPLTDLPEYFQPWMILGRKLEELVRNQTIRDEIDKMPLVDHTRLGNHKERRLAHIMLTFMMQGYVWVFGEEGVPAVLPKQLAIPLAGVCEHLGILPCTTNMAYGLANWKLKDPTKAPDLENLESIITLIGGNDFSWLFMVYVAMEMDCGPGLGAMVDGQQAVKDDNLVKLNEALTTMEHSIKQMTKTLSRMYEHCSPEVFYKVIWPHLHSFNSAAFSNKGLKGLVYEGVSEEPKQFLGGSEAPSSTIQSFDATLGIEPRDKDKNLLEDFRGYMPAAHREFIMALWNGPSIKNYVKTSGNNELKASYNGCLEALAQFRSTHIQMVTRYIIILAGKRDDNPNFPNAGSHFRESTDTIDWLKSLRDNTKQMNMST